MRNIPIEFFAKRLHADLQAIQENLGNLRHVLDGIEKHIQSIESGYKASREKVEPSPQLLPIEIRHPIPKEPSEKAREANESTRHWVLLGLEFLILNVTIAIAVFAYGQWVEMAGATGAAKKSADAAERAARSAEVATTKAIENEKLSQRAWVGVSELHYSIVPNRTSALAVYITNVGQTPALEVETKIRVFHQDMRSESPSLEKTRTNVGTVVMPGARYNSTVNGPAFSEEQLKLIQSESWRVYFLGAIWYKDVSATRTGLDSAAGWFWMRMGTRDSRLVAFTTTQTRLTQPGLEASLRIHNLPAFYGSPPVSSEGSRQTSRGFLRSA